MTVDTLGTVGKIISEYKEAVKSVTLPEDLQAAFSSLEEAVNEVEPLVRRPIENEEENTELAAANDKLSVALNNLAEVVAQYVGENPETEAVVQYLCVVTQNNLREIGVGHSTEDAEALTTTIRTEGNADKEVEETKDTDHSATQPLTEEDIRARIIETLGEGYPGLNDESLLSGVARSIDELREDQHQDIAKVLLSSREQLEIHYLKFIARRFDENGNSDFFRGHPDKLDVLISYYESRGMAEKLKLVQDLKAELFPSESQPTSHSNGRGLAVPGNEGAGSAANNNNPWAKRAAIDLSAAALAGFAFYYAAYCIAGMVSVASAFPMAAIALPFIASYCVPTAMAATGAFLGLLAAEGVQCYSHARG